LSFSPKITSFGFFTSAIGASARNKSGDDDIINQNKLNDYLIDRDTNNIKASLKYYFFVFSNFLRFLKDHYFYDYQDNNER
jgi:hypothetical protein